MSNFNWSVDVQGLPDDVAKYCRESPSMMQGAICISWDVATQKLNWSMNTIVDPKRLLEPYYRGNKGLIFAKYENGWRRVYNCDC